ncbi:MAG: glycosyltransferase family 4 protein [Lachnospiraceae bacterium]|nr:glycosyltransferase family 4 protein [Lachnospiraceae bacterium]
MDRRNMEIVFFIGNMSHSGGTERVLSVIANGLSERGYRVSIMSLWGTGKTFFSLDEEVKVFWAEEEAPKAGIIRKLKQLNAFLGKKKPDFLVDVDIILVFYSFFLKRLNPKVHWISWEHFNYHYHFKRNHSLRAVARRLVSRFSDQLIVLSEEDKGYYQQNLNLKCRITRIYNPNPYGDGEPEEAKEPVIFAAGRLTGVKGFDLLMKSWKMLEDKYPEWKVLVAGEGEDRYILEEQKKAAGLKNFHFIGNVSDIGHYYNISEIFVLSSRDEGFGMVLLEAMDFSLPAVSYSCKAGPGEIVIDGENGYLVEPGNVEMFAQKLELLMKDEELRRRMGRNAKESTKRFDREQILDDWEGVLGSMMTMRRERTDEYSGDSGQ